MRNLRKGDKIKFGYYGDKFLVYNLYTKKRNLLSLNSPIIVVYELYDEKIGDVIIVNSDDMHEMGDYIIL